MNALRHTRRLHAPETLEERKLMAADIYLDFNGASAADVRSLTAAVTVNRDLATSTGERSFVGEFAALQSQYGGYDRFRFLDFDGNGRLNATDGELAAARIMDKVKADFAPYDVRVLRVDSTATALSLMKASAGKDATVIVNGHHDEVGGQAPLDAGNRFDNGMKAGGSVGTARWVADQRLGDAVSREAFVNLIANFISHEVGHSFGLDHVDVVAHPSAISLITPLVGMSDLNFGDQEFAVTGGGRQNAHQYLTTTLGAAKNAWAAVLRPGTLTIAGSQQGDNLSVRESANGLSVIVNERVSWIAPGAAVREASINPYPTAIGAIEIYAGDGNDNISYYATTTAAPTLFAFGEGGNDLLLGSERADYLHGGTGDDTLVGYGGDDSLVGDAGRDILFGGLGADRIQGGTGEDLLVGEHAAIVDNAALFEELRRVWRGTGTYSSRVTSALSLLGRGGGYRTDRAVDRLWGQGDLDLFLWGTEDVIDRLTTERSGLA